MQVRTSPRCPDFVALQGRSGEYVRAKRILNAGRHPTFIGRSLYSTAARNGGVAFFQVDGVDAAVAIVQPRTNCLLVLCVHPKFRNLGLGQSVLAYLAVNFARVIESAVPFFERCGYVSIGEMKQGKRWKTQIMVLASVRSLAGRVAQLL
jgi:GNAT superfamily N-acetyltransferase